MKDASRDNKITGDQRKGGRKKCGGGKRRGANDLVYECPRIGRTRTEEEEMGEVKREREMTREQVRRGKYVGAREERINGS